MKLTKKHARKISELVSHGLVKGLGNPIPGQMCVEAVVCFALNLPHNDNPPCVGEAVRDYKIKLNDCNWDNNIARAEGMKYLAIAQLGSDIIDQKEFNKQIFIETQKQIIPLSFDYILKQYKIPEHDELKQFCIENTDREVLKAKFKNCYYYYHHYYHDYYHYYHNYYQIFHPDFKNILLNLSAKVAVDVLKKLKSPGCKWLDVVK